MDEKRMLDECAQLRGHVAAGLRESENIARLLDGATRTEAADGAGSAGGSIRAGNSTLGDGPR